MVLGYILGVIDEGVHPQIVLADEYLPVWTMHTSPQRSSLLVLPQVLNPPFADIWLLLHVVAVRSMEQCDAVVVNVRDEKTN
jgi:hypothetical protein